MTFPVRVANRKIYYLTPNHTCRDAFCYSKVLLEKKNCQKLFEIEFLVSSEVNIKLKHCMH